MPNQLVDPFVDDQFAPLDTRTGPQHIADLSQPDPSNPVPDPQQPVTPPAPDPDEIQTETIEIEGGQVTIEYDKKKGWTGTLSLDDGGGDEVFYGKTQRELMTNVLAGKVKATAQIRKLNKKLKLGIPVEEPIQSIPEPQVAQPKQLSANDIFEIKTALEADPDKAFELWFQKKFGLSAAQLVQIAQSADTRSKKGEEAYEELNVEAVSKEFLEAHENDYYVCPQNGDAVMAWLCRNKLRRNVKTTDTFGTISAELLRKGLYTVANLEEAYKDLKDSGLLTPFPREDIQELVVATPPVVSTPVQTVPSNPRIVSERRQPRGGLGIRSGSVSNSSQPVEPQAPSADDYENMTDKQISELLAATRNHVRSTRR